MYILYRRHQGFSLTKTVKTEPLPASVSEDIDYDQILVPIVGSRISDEMMVLACQLATEKKSAVDGLYVIEVPLNLPLDARLTAEREKADKVLATAARVADSFKVEFTSHVVSARQAGRAIVEEAERRRSEVIIVGTARKRRVADRAFGRTVDYVLDHAPCEVLLNLVPKEYPTGGTGDYGEGMAGAPAAAGPGSRRPASPTDMSASPEAPAGAAGDTPVTRE
jgi:nucleotide-binding universal stress UspA family protein